MASTFQTVEFDVDRFRGELAAYGKLLATSENLGERELHSFFKESNHLTAYIGTVMLNIGIGRQIGYEYDLSGRFRADIILGHINRHFCVVELEAGMVDSIFRVAGQKATKEWAPAFEHGFSQILDWFCLLDGSQFTPEFTAEFGHGPISFVGLLLVGRSCALSEDDRRRLRWRSQHVVVNSKHVLRLTYDDLYDQLLEGFSRYQAAGALKVPPV